MSAPRQTAALVGTPSQALDWVGAAGEDGLAVLVGAGAGDVTLAFMSPFGACVTRHPSDAGGPAFVARVVGEALAKGKLVSISYEDPGDAPGAPFPCEGLPAAGGWDAEAALALFRARAPDIPVRVCEGGEERATTWSIAPLGTVPFERGDRLSLEVSGPPGGSVVRWRGRGGRDAGVHVVLPREARAEEREIAGAADGLVLCAIHGEMPAPGGRRTVQTLVIDVPAEVVRSFADGRLPRHGAVRGETA